MKLFGRTRKQIETIERENATIRIRNILAFEMAKNIGLQWPARLLTK
jgi:hypothetical protein